MKIRIIWKLFFVVSLFGCSQNKIDVDVKRIKSASDKLYPLHSDISESNIVVNKYSDLININTINIASLSDENLKIALEDVFNICGCTQIYIFDDCQIFNVGQTEKSFKTEIYYVINSKTNCLDEASKLLQLESKEKLDENWFLVKKTTSLAN